MKKSGFVLCLIILILLTIPNINASSLKVTGNQTTSPEIENSRDDSERMGSADTLTGKVYSLAIFISTANNPWKNEDKLKVIEKQRAAQNWLIEQAENYDADLEFQNGNYGLNGADISVSTIPASDTKGNGMYKEWSTDLLKKAGYKTPFDLWKWVEKNTDCDNLQVIVYSNTSGVSYGVPYQQGMNAEKYFVEVAFVNRYYSTGTELYPSQIAHENLHLYGACDLYSTYKHKYDVGAKAKEHFPNDVMYRNSYDLKQMEINELTAWRIGWSDEEEPWYEWFKPGK